MTKIQFTDTPQDVVMKLSEGNPGALSVCMQVLLEGTEIDPDGFGGGLGALLGLDTLGIYEPRIWMLYKDVCRQDLPTMLAMLRGWQLGIINADVLNHAIDNYGQGLDILSAYAKVHEQLPAFRYAETEVEAEVEG